MNHRKAVRFRKLAYAIAKRIHAKPSVMQTGEIEQEFPILDDADKLSRPEKRKLGQYIRRALRALKKAAA